MRRNLICTLTFFLTIVAAPTASRAQESAECGQLRDYFDGSIKVFAQIGPRLEQLERTPGPTAANEQRQLAKVGLERATKMQEVAARAQSLSCKGFRGGPANWATVLNDAKRLTVQFSNASKRP